MPHAHFGVLLVRVHVSHHSLMSTVQIRVPHARQEVYDTTRWVAYWCVVSVCTRVSHAWQACNDNETVIPMCMHSDYIYIVSYSSHGHSVLINGAATVSIESEGISNPQ